METPPNAQCLVKTVCVHLAEISFSIVRRKVLNPNDFASLRDLQAHLLEFQTRYTLSAKPFQWTFTRRHLAGLLNRMRCAEDRVAA